MEINSSLPLWTTRSDTRLAEVAKAAESTRTVATPQERAQEDLDSFVEARTYDRLGQLPSGPNIASDFEIWISEQVKRPHKENARPLEQINAELNMAHAGFQELYGKMLRELSGREPVMPDGMVGISVDGQGKIIVRNHNGLLRDDVAQRLSARMNASEELLRYANRYVELAIERVESDMNVNFDGLGRYHLDKENFSSVVTAMEFNSLQGHLLSWGVIRYGYWTEPKLYTTA
ncbi:hypothetical protein R0G64_10485 [Pseudomonas otitidis]|uniref:Uncharacterized protein n=1 Tax=Metapseudomonas otitidis TaxID=319939 RepID=A0ABU3XPM7_9GAMM|nr:hypothetical protein [Pseudomonas otitidis]MDV3439852.1 hypothetical protein [Pseudomonas otitidis]MEE1892832.1 hypothetical protein [Pseudomonas otitidis]WMR35388.1 hypothetical protein QT513_11860 [Pseudomonas otitidis]